MEQQKTGKSGKNLLVEADSGMLVRVPEEKLESWERAQKERGSEPLSSSERRVIDRILQMLYG